MTEQQTLTEEQWDALARAEQPLYGNGIYPYTDVNPRDDGGLAWTFWQQAETYVLNELEDDQPERVMDETAERVADAICVLGFGRDYLAEQRS